MVVPDMYVSEKFPLKRMTRKFTDKNISRINEELSNIDWQKELNATSSNTGFTTFHNMTLEIVNRIAPIKTVTITKLKKTFIDQTILDLLQ